MNEQEIDFVVKQIDLLTKRYGKFLNSWVIGPGCDHIISINPETNESMILKIKGELFSAFPTASVKVEYVEPLIFTHGVKRINRCAIL